MREPPSPGLKLAVTLRHLASGYSYPSLQYVFRVARSTINKFVPEVCDAIIRAYRDQVLTCPTLPEDWLEVESIFSHMPFVPLMEGTFQSDVKMGRQLLPQLQGLSLYSTPGPSEWRLQLPLGEC